MVLISDGNSDIVGHVKNHGTYIIPCVEWNSSFELFKAFVWIDSRCRFEIIFEKKKTIFLHAYAD